MALQLAQANAKSAEPRAPDSPPNAAAARLRPDFTTMKEVQLERAAAIEATLKTEPRDRAWASTTESQLRTAVDTAIKEGAQYSVRTLRCLTSVCEMVLSASSPEELRYTSFQLGPRIAGMSSYDVAQPETAADGTATVTYRLFRMGYQRPDEGM